MEFYDLALNVFELLQGALNAQGVADMSGVCDPSIAPGVVNSNFCPASSFTAIGAAFATMGYWMQSDLLDHLTFTTLGIWAPLVYIISAVAGMFGVAMGQPPRNYVWFFIGPALYAWLIDTRIDVDGVSWKVAEQHQNQSEVWKLAEVGLINSNLYNRMESSFGVNSVEVSADTAPKVPLNITGMSEQPRSAVAVALPFLWFDWLISGTVDSLVTWTGVYQQASRSNSSSLALRTNVTVTGSANPNRNKWYLLSNLKWTYLEDITGAKLGHAMLRASWAQFMGSECGEILSESIDHTLFVAATSSKGLSVPTTVFRRPPSSSSLFDYNILKAKMRLKHIPTPPPFKRALTKTQSFQNLASATVREAVDWGSNIKLTNNASARGDYIDRVLESNSIRCDHFLDMLILMFRFEATSIYNTTFKDSNLTDLDDVDIINNILYGWDVKKQRGGAPTGSPVASHSTVNGQLVANDGLSLNQEERFQFIHNLILMHLMKNEFAMSPPKADVRYSLSAQTTGWMQAYQANIGGKNKYMELYTWAILLPYIQGILMYFLAMMYPIACIMIIMPGQHKWIFTWASFWAWVKLWDLGFAIVMSLERTVWAMIGNNAKITKVFDRIVELDSIATFRATCSANPDPALPGCKWSQYVIESCGVQHKVDAACGNSVTVLGMPMAVDMQDINLRFLDMALSVGANMNLSLSNTYYIYIMAALYMAVPAVTGQLVLGARSGAASMVNSAIGGASQEGGRQAGEGFKGKKVQDDKTTEASRSQAVKAKSLRKGGRAASAIGASNNAALQGMSGDYQNQMGSGFDRLANAKTLGRMGLDNSYSIIGQAGQGLGGGAGSPARSSGAPGVMGRESLDTVGHRGGGGTSADGTVSGGEQPGNPSSVGGGGGVSTGGGAGATARRRAANMQALKKAKLGNAGKFGSEILGKMGSPAMVSTAIAAAKAANFRGNARADNFYKGMQGNTAIQGFGNQQAAKSSGEHGQRSGQAADFQADQDAWMEMTEWASDISGSAVAQGAMTGAYSQGNMPSSQMGMAMTGMLGGNTQNLANYFDPSSGGGFMAAAKAKQGGLQTAVGKGASDAAYKEYSMATAFGKALSEGSGYLVQKNQDGRQAQVEEGLERSRR